mmetsp:Transcript_14906/g.32891  ORF Transcript_14906/g.32891 Transcript_14906/m.32891 type:complete len:208 (+) Transcript_14906:1427-2050(+)
MSTTGSPGRPVGVDGGAGIAEFQKQGATILGIHTISEAGDCAPRGRAQYRGTPQVVHGIGTWCTTGSVAGAAGVSAGQNERRLRVHPVGFNGYAPGSAASRFVVAVASHPSCGVTGPGHSGGSGGPGSPGGSGGARCAGGSGRACCTGCTSTGSTSSTGTSSSTTGTAGCPGGRGSTRSTSRASRAGSASGTSGARGTGRRSPDGNR